MQQRVAEESCRSAGQVTLGAAKGINLQAGKNLYLTFPQLTITNFLVSVHVFFLFSGGLIMRKIKTVSIIPYKLYPSQKYSQSQGSQLKQSDGESTNKKFVFIQQGRYPHYRYYPTLLLPKGVAVSRKTPFYFIQ